MVSIFKKSCFVNFKNLKVILKNEAAVKLHENLGFAVHSKGLNKNNEVVLIYVYYL